MLGRILGVFITIAVICWLCGTSLSNVVDDVQKSKKACEAKIGEKVVIQGDTLMVVDYSYIKESFTLSNGVEVNKGILIK